MGMQPLRIPGLHDAHYMPGSFRSEQSRLQSRSAPTREETRVKTAVLYDDLWGRFDREAFEFALAQSEQYFTLPPEDIRGKRCLDVGCGVGFFVTRLFRAGAAEVHATDIGRKNLENTLRWNAAWKGKLVLTADSVDALRVSAHTFDAVHCNGVLHHTEDPEKGFRELVRVTKPGGITVVGVYGRGGLMPLAISLLRRVASVLPYAWASRMVSLLFRTPYNRYLVLDFLYVPIVHRYHEREVRRWFEQAEYRAITRSPLHARYRYGSVWAKILHGEGYITMWGRHP